MTEVLKKVNEVKVVSESSEAKKIILASSKKVEVSESKVEVSESKVVLLYGKKFGKKPNSNLRIAVKLFEQLKDKENLTFNFLFDEYKKLLLKNDLKVDKNTKGRLRRILYRSIETGIIRDTDQAIKFNLYANYNGIKIVTKNKFNYDPQTFNVDPKEVYNNLYTFKFANKVTRKLKADITKTILKKIEALKNPKKVNK